MGGGCYGMPLLRDASPTPQLQALLPGDTALSCQPSWGTPSATENRSRSSLLPGAACINNRSMQGCKGLVSVCPLRQLCRTLPAPEFPVGLPDPCPIVLCPFPSQVLIPTPSPLLHHRPELSSLTRSLLPQQKQYVTICEVLRKFLSIQ